MKYFKLFKNKLTLVNGPDGYKITEDAIWLSSVLPLDKKTYLEIGCASGVISFILSIKNPNSKIKAIDVQPNLIIRAEELKKLNNINNVTFENKDLFDIDQNLELFDCVFSNPPFFDENKTQKTLKTTRAKAHFQPGMSDFISKMLSLTKEDGILCFIAHKSTRQEVLDLIKDKYNIVEIGLKSSPYKDPKRFIYILNKGKDVKYQYKVLNSFDEKIRNNVLFEYKDLKNM